MDLGNGLQTAEVIIGTLSFVVATISAYLTWHSTKAQIRFWEHNMQMQMLPMHARPDPAPIRTQLCTASAIPSKSYPNCLVSFIKHLTSTSGHWLRDHVDDLRRWSAISIENATVRVFELGKRCAVWICGRRVVHMKDVARQLSGAVV